MSRESSQQGSGLPRDSLTSGLSKASWAKGEGRTSFAGEVGCSTGEKAGSVSAGSQRLEA